MARKFKDWGDAHVAGIKVRKVADEAWAKAGPEQGQGNEDDEAAADTIDIAMWPIMQSKAMHGIVGEIAKLATAKSEADPVAIIGTTLTWAAAEFGRSQFMRIGDDQHHSRHFTGIVGRSSKARKGTSTNPVRRIFGEAERILRSASSNVFPSGSPLKVSNGPLSSGEGLVYAIRDGDDEPGDDGDKGVIDKRILCVEGELGAAFRAFQRTGNNLSMILRMAFDGGTIAPLIKNNRTIATDPHINLVGHITRPELKELLTATEIWNGLGNRFIWLCVRRPKIEPFPTPMPEDKVLALATKLAGVIRQAHELKRELVLSNSAMNHWGQVYPELTQERPGIFGAVTARAEAHVRRLAMTYAQLDGAERVEIDHMEAALAVWRYADDSAAYLFGAAKIDPVPLKILEAVRKGPKTQTEISNLFARHLNKEQLAAALGDLQERGLISLAIEETLGAPRKVWSAAK